MLKHTLQKTVTSQIQLISLLEYIHLYSRIHNIINRYGYGVFLVLFDKC